MTVATSELTLEPESPRTRLRDDRRGRTGAVATMLVVTALFLSHAVDGLYDGLDRQAPEAWAPLSSIFVSMSIVAWFWEYSRCHRIAWVLDMGWFLLAAWIIIVPYYLLKREGRRGLGRIGLFCLTYAAAWATGVAIRIWIRVVTPT